MSKVLANFINGEWKNSHETETSVILNPANQDVLGELPLGKGNVKDVETAIDAASKAFNEWSKTPVNKRIQPLFLLKTLLEEHKDELADIITNECGKTKGESLGELTRAIENVEMACGTPALMQSEFSEDIAEGIDEFMIRQPVGVCACIAPFNFPGMIPFWFLPYAIACGNTFIIKPSEKVPLTMKRVFELIEQLDLPAGVINLVNGGKEAVETLLTHPDVRAISFVGSTQVARHIYATAAAHGKRVQAQGGAKNPIIVLPDADPDMTTKIVTDSVYGCAGQRCLAASTVVTVGDDSGEFTDALVESARSRTTGYGLNEGVEMGPVISESSKIRIAGLIQMGAGRRRKPIAGWERSEN